MAKSRIGRVAGGGVDGRAWIPYRRDGRFIVMGRGRTSEEAKRAENTELAETEEEAVRCFSPGTTGSG